MRPRTDLYAFEVASPTGVGAAGGEADVVSGSSHGPVGRS